MFRFLRPGLVAAVAAVLVFVPACSRSTKPKVAIVTNCTASFWKICKAGAQKAANEDGVDLDFREPQAMEVAVQRQVIDSVTQTGIKGLAVSVVNPEAETDYLARLSKTVPVITMDNDAPDSGRRYYVGINNYEAGKALGRLIKQRMPQGGTVVVFIGGKASDNAKGRIGGVLDELAGATSRQWAGADSAQLGAFTLRTIRTDGGDEAEARRNADAEIGALLKTPNVALVGLYAYNPKQILRAYQAKKADVVHPMKIFGFDEDWVTLEGVAKGEIEGTVVQNPFKYGYNSVKILATLAKGGSVPDDQAKGLCEIPYRVITKDGGPTETVNGVTVENLKATEFEQQLRADLDSVGEQ